MGMSTHVVGIIPGDTELHKGMMSIWRTCIKMKVSVPDEVIKYFGDEDSDEAGKLVDIERTKHTKNSPVTPWQDESAQGFEVDVTKLPPGVTKLRFYNSW